MTRAATILALTLAAALLVALGALPGCRSCRLLQVIIANAYASERCCCTAWRP